MRRLIAFPCEGETLLATLDGASGRTALLIVSGGNEIRTGAHRGMAALASEIAGAGYPVLRFDRRGVGDSTGSNAGYLSSAPDIAAAAALLRAETGAARVVGFGNCDAASALALFGRAAGIDAVVLANPWVIEQADDLPPAAAIRARYAQRLRDPAAWGRLLRGAVSLPKLARGLLKLARRAQPATLAGRVLESIAGWNDAASVVLAKGDATAIAFADAAGDRPDARTIATDSHSFAPTAAARELRDLLLERLRG